jgi:hypothetical protein
MDNYAGFNFNTYKFSIIYIIPQGYLPLPCQIHLNTFKMIQKCENREVILPGISCLLMQK